MLVTMGYNVRVGVGDLEAAGLFEAGGFIRGWGVYSRVVAYWRRRAAIR